MTGHLLRPALAGLALSLVWLAAAREPVAAPRAPSSPRVAAALLRDLEILHARAHVARDRLAWLDVGEYPLPPPRRWTR